MSDKHEKKTEELALQTSAIKEIAKEIGDQMMAVQLASQQMAKGPAPRLSKKNQVGECGTCGQLNSACNNEHALMVVFPTRYPEFGKWFQGRRLNGVRYLSANQTHKIYVPKAAVGDIQKAIEGFEETERINLTGRKAEHDSGEIGPGSSGSREAHVGWR